jgi:hypothetical protein
MRAWDVRTELLFSYVNCEQRVPKDHPLRAILRIVDEALAALTLEFEGLYAKFGLPSIPPRALLLQAFYSVRSERQLMASGLSAPFFPLRRGPGIVHTLALRSISVQSANKVSLVLAAVRINHSSVAL